MPVDQHGYVYDALRKLGLSAFGAETGEFLVRPLTIGFVLLIAWMVGRIGGRAVRRTVQSVQARSPMRPASARAEQRVGTIGDVFARLLRVVVWSIATLVVLDMVGINLAPLLAGAGIAGVAIGFGAQSLVKDVISGMFIVLEDQYGAGDVVTLGEVTGTVETLGLRSTRLRAVDGTVWFVPNGETRRVGNTSMEWSRALVDVLVAYDSDLDVVRSVLQEEADGLAADPAWVESVLEPPELWGVQSMTADGLTLRLVVKTAPGRQFPVARQLRGRISARLRREGVQGPGQLLPVTLTTGNDQPPTGVASAVPTAAPAAEPQTEVDTRTRQ